MNILFVVLFAVLYAAQGIPSKGVTHGARSHSMKNDLSQHTFIEEIPNDSLGTVGAYGVDPKIEAVGYDHEHTYEDFSADAGRYPEYEQFRSFEGFEDVIPRDVRVSGLSYEDQEKRDYPDTDGDTTEDKQSTSRTLHDTVRDSESLSTSAGLGDDLDMPEGEVEDVTVEGLSDYSYLVGDKLHGINEFMAASAMGGARIVRDHVEGSEEFENFDYEMERDEELNYEKFLGEEEREVQDYEDDHEYGHANDVKIRGQAVEDEEDEDYDEDEFEEDEELDESERFEDGDYDDDGDDEEDEDEDDGIDADVRTRDMGDEGEYEEDENEFDEDDFAIQDEEENQIDTKVNGMAVGILTDEDEFDEEDEEEEFDDEDDDEYEDDLPETGRQYEDEEEEGEEYENDYIRDLDEDDEADEDDEDWDEEEDDFDSTRDAELDDGVPEVDEDEESESLHGDEIKPGVKTERRK